MDTQRPVAEPTSHRAAGRRRVRTATAAAAVGFVAVATVGGLAVSHPTVAIAGTATAAAGQLGRADGYGGGTLAAVSAGMTRAATPAEAVGVVDVDTVLSYGSGRAAGTGIVLTSSGEILTNNHVVDGATSITATVVGTGATYTATVVGTDPGDDIAVLRLSGAAGLSTARIATDTVAVGDAVTAVGNAGGTGGTPTAATGTVVALGQSITASDGNGADAERLTGLIETDAAIEAGDSGGPLTADGAVIGIDTAASSTGRPTLDAANTAGYAIPIRTATAIADRIVSGEQSAAVHQGYPAFLGVEIARTADGGATVSGVLRGSAAATAGLQAGDTVTAVDGTAVDGPDALGSALTQHRPQDRVRVTWTDTAGASHTATVTLAAGPAD